MACDSCQMLRINGVLCHETGCPDAWRTHTKECFECGCEFAPETRNQRLCEDCAFESLADDVCDDSEEDGSELDLDDSEDA